MELDKEALEELKVMREFLCGCDVCSFTHGTCVKTAFNYVAEIIRLRKQVEELKKEGRSGPETKSGNA